MKTLILTATFLVCAIAQDDAGYIPLTQTEQMVKDRLKEAGLFNDDEATTTSSNLTEQNSQAPTNITAESNPESSITIEAKCNDGQTFDTKLNTCIECSGLEVFNQVTQQCEQCPFGTYPQANSCQACTKDHVTCNCDVGFKFKDGVCSQISCPSKQYLLVSEECVLIPCLEQEALVDDLCVSTVCPLGFVWNVDQCSSVCSSNQTFSVEKKACECPEGHILTTPALCELCPYGISSSGICNVPKRQYSLNAIMVLVMVAMVIFLATDGVQCYKVKKIDRQEDLDLEFSKVDDEEMQNLNNQHKQAIIEETQLSQKLHGKTRRRTQVRKIVLPVDESAETEDPTRPKSGSIVYQFNSRRTTVKYASDNTIKPFSAHAQLERTNRKIQFGDAGGRGEERPNTAQVSTKEHDLQPQQEESEKISMLE